MLYFLSKDPWLTFPFLALIFSVFGILVLYRGSRYYLQATYAISVLRNKLDIENSLKKDELKAFGIDDLLCDRFSSAKEYVKKRSINLNLFRIRTIIYWIYIVLAVISVIFMCYVISTCAWISILKCVWTPKSDLKAYIPRSSYVP